MHPRFRKKKTNFSKIRNSEKSSKHNKSRSVIITRGKYPCLVLNGNKEGLVESFPTFPLKEKDIVDTNGAGDAFVGGLLAEIASNVKNGLYLTDVIYPR